MLDPRARFGPPYAVEMVIAVDPSYKNRFVITARQDNGPRKATFRSRSKAGFKALTRFVFLDHGQASPGGWRYGVTTLLLPRPGRYVLFFHGNHLNEAIPFGAELP